MDVGIKRKSKDVNETDFKKRAKYAYLVSLLIFL